jgi:F-type H+-transporting ATPase subunit delta
VRDAAVAARYAKALFIAAGHHKETEAALADLGAVGTLLAPGSRAARFFASPEVRLQDKRELLRRALDQRAVRSTVVFVDLLLRKKRLHELPLIVAEYETLVERAQGIQRAQLVSAVPFGQAELARLQKQLETRLSARVKLSAVVDERLLGGALVRIGDQVIDRSVRTLLGAIAARLHEVTV